MDALLINKTEDTPEILFNPAANSFTMSGKSIPEDVNAFYKPVLNWLEQYIQNPNSKTTLEIKMKYFNTASSKMIMDILLRFEKLKANNKEIEIKWFYPSDDDDMKDAGEEYAELIEVPFELIAT